jgi:class 3 adenylate cyclase
MASTRRLAAILAADVAGYSRLMGADEEGTHERLKAHLRQLVEPKISEHKGRIVKNTGDGLLRGEGAPATRSKRVFFVRRKSQFARVSLAFPMVNARNSSRKSDDLRAGNRVLSLRFCAAFASVRQCEPAQAQSDKFRWDSEEIHCTNSAQCIGKLATVNLQ